MNLRTTIQALVFVTLAAILFIGCGGNDSSTNPPTGTAPTISGVSPSSGTVGTEIQISGTNFRAGATVLLNTLLADSIEVLNDTIIYATIPAGVDTSLIYTVTVRNTDGTQAALTASFTPVAPNVQFVNSATKPSGNSGSTVIIEGDAFGDYQGTGQVLFSDGAGGTITATIASPSDWTNTFIVTTVPSGANSGDIVVQTATGISQALVFNVTQNSTFSPSAINWPQIPKKKAPPEYQYGHDKPWLPEHRR